MRAWRCLSVLPYGDCSELFVVVLSKDPLRAACLCRENCARLFGEGRDGTVGLDDAEDRAVDEALEEVDVIDDTDPEDLARTPSGKRGGIEVERRFTGELFEAEYRCTIGALLLRESSCCDGRRACVAVAPTDAMCPAAPRLREPALLLAAWR